MWESPKENETIVQSEFSNAMENQSLYGASAGLEQTVSSQQNHSSARGKRFRPQNIANPLQVGILEYLTKHLSPSFLSLHGLSLPTLVSFLPKRYTIYHPLLLLPLNTFSSTPQWQVLYSILDPAQLETLCACIVASFGSTGVTHIAINAPIALKNAAGEANRTRSPTGLNPLYGDFGPLPSALGSLRQPRASDFESALWVRAVQNNGIAQVWAPLYTMFSRGNIVEKARILGRGSPFRGLDYETLRERIQDISVVDMYGGIGYFVFSYLKRGVARVWAWEINGWSVEGLCRGCRENGWSVKIVRVAAGEDIEGRIKGLTDELKEEDRVVVFHGDNTHAEDVMGRVKSELEKKGAWKRVRHVNLGLLPSSRASWESAAKVLDQEFGGWIHVHENVHVHDIDKKRDEIIRDFRSLLQSPTRTTLRTSISSIVGCQHVERVKTYAPGVMHCVFDINVPPIPCGWDQDLALTK